MNEERDLPHTKPIAAVLVALSCGLFSGLATAAQYNGTLNITPPSTRTDGTPLPASEIRAYRIFFNCNATPAQQGGNRVGPPPIQANPLFPADGVYQVCVDVIDQQDRVSAKSNILVLDVSEVARPSAPSLDGINVTCPSGAAPRVTPIPGGFKVECDAP